MVSTLLPPLLKYQGMRFAGNVAVVQDLDSTQETLIIDKWKMLAVDGEGFVEMYAAADREGFVMSVELQSAVDRTGLGYI